MEGRSIPLLKTKSKGVRRVFSIKNVGVDTIDYAKSASYEVIAPRSVGFLKLAIPANKDLIGKDVCFESMQNSQGLNNDDLFQLKEGIIKIKLSGNNKYYAQIPYINYDNKSRVLKKIEFWEHCA